MEVDHGFNCFTFYDWSNPDRIKSNLPRDLARDLVGHGRSEPLSSGQTRTSGPRSSSWSSICLSSRVGGGQRLLGER